MFSTIHADFGFRTTNYKFQSLQSKGWMDALRAYIRADRPFFGICIGMQSLFEGSDESPSFEGLGIIPGRVTRFNSVGANGETVRVPQMGWNGVSPVRESVVFEEVNPQDAVRHYYCLVAMYNFISSMRSNHPLYLYVLTMASILSP
jgi:imidazoleglycerol phosphate synthase glutamine amidotransferase subunit HisH